MTATYYMYVRNDVKNAAIFSLKINYQFPQVRRHNDYNTNVCLLNKENMSWCQKIIPAIYYQLRVPSHLTFDSQQDSRQSWFCVRLTDGRLTDYFKQVHSSIIGG